MVTSPVSALPLVVVYVVEPLDVVTLTFTFGFLGAVFLATAFFAGAFLATCFLGAAFFAGVFLAGCFFAAAFFGVVFFAAMWETLVGTVVHMAVLLPEEVRRVRCWRAG